MFQNYLEFEQALKADGWHRPRGKSPFQSDDNRVLIRRVAGVWLTVMFSCSYSDYAALIPPLSDPKVDPVRVDFRSNSIEDFWRAAKRLVADFRKVAKPKRADRNRFAWRNESGKEGFKNWQVELEQRVLETVQPAPPYSHRQLPHTTAEIAQILTGNGGYELLPDAGMSRAEFGRHLRALLERLWRQGKVNKETGDRVPRWESK